MTFPKWNTNGTEKLKEISQKFADYPEAIDLLTQMVQLEPSKRITIKGALNHPFFKEYNQTKIVLPQISPTRHKYKTFTKKQLKTAEKSFDRRLTMEDVKNDENKFEHLTN